MQYEIVKEHNLYVIVIEGQGILKLRSRREAIKLVAAAIDIESPCDPQGARVSPARSAKSGTKDSLLQSAGFLSTAQ